MKTLTGKVAVVTGAGSGIGRALAQELAQAGARLALSDVDEAGLDETAAIIRREAPDCDLRCYSLDVSSREAVLAHADQVQSDFGTAHLLFNNAGVALFASVQNMTLDEFDWIMQINLYGVVHGTKAFLPMMLAQDEGHIVNVSSVLGLIAAPAASAYVTSKFAVRGFTESLTRELMPTNVYASCVHPGGIKTNISTKGRMGSAAGAYEQDCIARGESLLKTDPREMAAAILRGVAKRKTRIVAGHSSTVADVLGRLFPARYGRILQALGK